MDSDANKIFVGGISWETTDEKLKEYFESYGSVVEAVIMKDRTTGRGRGFGFVVFADPEVADRVVLDKHHISGKAVEAKKAVPKDENQNPSRGGAGNVQPSGAGSGGSSSRTKKIFVGGLAPSVTEEEFRAYFEQFGNITDVVVMYDHATQRPRGFGFITFDGEEAVDNVLQKTFHELKGKMVEVKRAVPKDASAPGRSPTSAAFPRGPFAAATAAAAYAQGFAAGPYAYGPRAYPSYAGYAGYSYGYAGYGAGAYSPAGATGYGAAAAGYGGAAGSYAPAAAGRTSWQSYGGSSPAYGGNGASMSGYGAGATAGWASPQQGTTQGSGSYVGGYSYAAAGNDGNGGGGGYSYGAARSGGYAAGGYGTGNAAPAYSGGSYGEGYGYQQDNNSWRSAEAYNSTVQTGTPAGYGSSSAATESGAGNGAAAGGGYGGYGTTRQTQRGLTAA